MLLLPQVSYFLKVKPTEIASSEFLCVSHVWTESVLPISLLILYRKVAPNLLDVRCGMFLCPDVKEQIQGPRRLGKVIYERMLLRGSRGLTKSGTLLCFFV